MKKLLLIGSICSAMLFVVSCDNNSSEPDTHMHVDGSTHADHDTTKPVQQEFNVADTVKKDSSVHMHDNGEQHSH